MSGEKINEGIDTSDPMPKNSGVSYIHFKGNLKKRTTAVKLALLIVLLGTAALYIIGLDKNGWANQFYSAAAQAGSVNWESFLWGSLDSANSITVDKPPASLWVMALSIRLFGLNSWSILVPEALMGVGAPYLVYATLRRSFGDWCGILAAAVMATTPVACLMFRFNNPDALLIFLLCGATYSVTRAIELPDTHDANKVRTWWMVLAGLLMGLAFLTKQLQAFLVLPAFGCAFLLASPTGWKRRWLDALAAFGALVVAAGWWVVLTVVVPASSRPYFGGSQTNSFLELTFSYNGLGRITGSMEGAVVGGTSTSSTTQTGIWGQTGITRLFDGIWGTQWSWLAPAALMGIAVAFLVCGRIDKSSRQDSRRVQAILWGGWLLVTGLVFSFMSGTIHQYYTVALVPATASLAAICVYLLWNKARDSSRNHWRLAAMALTGIESAWTITLLLRSDWYVWLRFIVLICGALSILVQGALWVFARKGKGGNASQQVLLKGAKRLDLLAYVALTLALTASCIAPIFYSLYTASQAHSGSIVTAGPSVSQTSTSGNANIGGATGAGGFGSSTQQGIPSSNLLGGSSGGGMRLDDGAGMSGDNNADSGISSSGEDSSNQGNMSSLLSGEEASAEVASLLSDNSDSYTWVAATVGSQNAASYQLACQLPVMAIGGFNGSDPSPTLEEFEAYVASGEIHYFIGGSVGGTQIGGSDDAEEIAEWVASNYEAQTVDGVTIYDLS